MTFKWHRHDGYAATRIAGSRKKQRMHQLLSPAPLGLVTDHINRDRLDNRRVNLRHVTKSENNRNANVRPRNTSGYTGVTYSKQNNRWIAQISINNNNYYIGSYATKLDAAKARVDFEDQLTHRPETIIPKGPLLRNNTSGVRGIYPSRPTITGQIHWKVQIRYGGRNDYLGTYVSIDDAKRALADYNSLKPISD